MAASEEKRMIVGLDIGTSKVVAVVGEIDADGTIDIVGIGSHPSKGTKKGVVVNIESTVNAIQRAVEEAELMAGCQIHSVYVGIAGNHIRSMNSTALLPSRIVKLSGPTSIASLMRRSGRHPRGSKNPSRTATGICD